LHADRHDHFAWFGTTLSRSRLNFLELLHAGHADYGVNAEALAYKRLVHKLEAFTEAHRAQPPSRDLRLPDVAFFTADEIAT
jgi:hypothetical protein